MIRLFFGALGAVLATSSSAFAHTGVEATSGFLSGFLHPLGGLDHILAMVAVGLLAAQQGGRSLFYVPASFVGMIIMGAVAALAGLTIPFVELGIVGSVILLGMVVAFGRNFGLGQTMVFVGVLAIFHGYAHGMEMPLNVDGAQYAAGFALATSLLHGLGLVAGLGARKVNAKAAPIALRFSGAAVGIAGVVLLAL